MRVDILPKPEGYFHPNAHNRIWTRIEAIWLERKLIRDPAAYDTIVELELRL